MLSKLSSRAYQNSAIFQIFNGVTAYNYSNLLGSFMRRAFLEPMKSKKRLKMRWDRKLWVSRYDNGPPVRTGNFSVRRTAVENWGTIFTRGTVTPIAHNAPLSIRLDRAGCIGAIASPATIGRTFRWLFFCTRWNIDSILCGTYVNLMTSHRARSNFPPIFHRIFDRRPRGRRSCLR